MNNHDARPFATVIIPARDEAKNLARCLAGVMSQQTPWPFEVIVIDSGSTDHTAEVAHEAGARVISIRRYEFQHGRTRRLGSREAKGEFIVFTVADAVPADPHWLVNLVNAVASDPRVAGAYSRQLPREGATALEAHRLSHRGSSGETREVRELAARPDFWSLPPIERLRFCEFDDVSACYRASLLGRFPIPEADWAEDLVWAKQVLLAGWKIIYEPSSLVRHSHADTLTHAFRRGWLDQTVAHENFGVIYFSSLSALFAGFVAIYKEQARVIRNEPNFLSLLLWNALRLAAELKGNFFASLPLRTKHRVSLLNALIHCSALRKRHSRQILQTSFTLGSDTRRVLFMNPNAASVINLRVPSNSRLVFGAGINPQARGLLKAPVDFIAAINGQPVWRREVFDKPGLEQPKWIDAAIDLSLHAGKTISLAFITRSPSTDHAWAGWSEPAIETDGQSIIDRAYNAVLEKAADFAAGRPLRHP